VYPIHRHVVVSRDTFNSASNVGQHCADGRPAHPRLTRYTIRPKPVRRRFSPQPRVPFTINVPSRRLLSPLRSPYPSLSRCSFPFDSFLNHAYAHAHSFLHTPLPTTTLLGICPSPQYCAVVFVISCVVRTRDDSRVHYSCYLFPRVFVAPCSEFSFFLR